MPFNVNVRVRFNDAGNFPNVKTYPLLLQLADDSSNMAAVQTAAADLVAALNVLTWDNIDLAVVEVETEYIAAAANVASNNSVEAFHRTTDSVTGEKLHFIVPAWDDAVYDKDPSGALSAAYNTAAAAVAALLRNPSTGNAVTYVGAQNRAVKRGQRLYKL